MQRIGLGPVCTESLIQDAGVRWITLACLEKVSFQFLSLRQLVLSLFERNLFPEISRRFPEVTGIHVLTSEARGRNLRSLVAAFARILTYAISCFGSLMFIR